MHRRPWEIPLRDYIASVPVTEDLPEDHPTLLTAESDLDEMGRACESWRAFSVPDRPDLEIRLKSGAAALIRIRDTGEVLGGNVFRLTYVRPAWRGQGLAAELHVRTDLEGCRLPATHYSRSGLQARIKAHGLHVERALLEGEDVPDDVLHDYSIMDTGRLGLVEMHAAVAEAVWLSRIRANQDCITRG
jgi:GNAT superfamily N-acetyltransferase